MCRIQSSLYLVTRGTGTAGMFRRTGRLLASFGGSAVELLGTPLQFSGRLSRGATWAPEPANSVPHSADDLTALLTMLLTIRLTTGGG